MEEWKQRLKAAREQAGENGKRMSKTDFARRIPVSPATATDWEKSVEDGGIKEITGKNLTRVCEVLGITAQWLLHGREPREAARPPQPYDEVPGAFPAGTDRMRKIPAYGKAMAGIPDRIWGDGDYPAGASDVYAEVSSGDPNAFLVPIEGVSGVPRFNPGEYALVEPGTTPELEDDVLVRLKDGRTMLKRLLSRRGGIRLGSYNDPEVINTTEEDVVWMYYVAHPVPARKIKTRI